MKRRVLLAGGGRRAFGAACLLLLAMLPAFAEGKKEMDDPVILEYGIRIEAPRTFKGTDLHVGLIRLKEFAELKPLPANRPLFILFNLDIYGEKNGKKISVGSDGFTPPITVYLAYSGEGGPKAEDLWYWIPGEGWVAHKEMVKKPGADMQVTPIQYDKVKGYSFQITRWPIDDRMIAADG